MKKTTFPKTNLSASAPVCRRSDFTVLPGDRITLRFEVRDSNQDIVHVSESVCRALSFGRIVSVDVYTSFRSLEVSKQEFHYSRKNENRIKVDK